MGCFMSCSSSGRKNHHHYSTTDDSAATLAPYQRCNPTRCRPPKKSSPPETHNGGTDTNATTTTHRKKGARHRRQDDIPKLPKTFFMMGQQSSDGGEERSRPFTPTTADPFSESLAFDPSESSPIHWGIWRRKDVYTIPLASEMGSFACRSPMAAATTPPRKADYPTTPLPLRKDYQEVDSAVPEIIKEAEKVGKPLGLQRERLEAFAEKRRAAAAVAAAAARQRSEFGFGCGMFRNDFEGELSSSPAWTPVIGSFAMRSPARGGSPFSVSGRSSSRWSGRAIANGVRIRYLNDDVCVKKWEQGGADQSVDGSYLSMECFVF